MSDEKIVIPADSFHDDSIPSHIQGKVDAWLRERGLNAYGDPEGTFYAGGTPLFSESSGESTSRWEHLKNRFPELKGL